MLKREITFEDFDGEEVTETHYFNLTKTEMINLEASYDSGLEKAMQRIIVAQDKNALIQEFQKIVLLAYGVRDGSRFIKNDEVREHFTQTAAYDALFIELVSDSEAAANFIEGIIPKEWAVEAKKEASSLMPPPPVKE